MLLAYPAIAAWTELLKLISIRNKNRLSHIKASCSKGYFSDNLINHWRGYFMQLSCFVGLCSHKVIYMSLAYIKGFMRDRLGTSTFDGYCILNRVCQLLTGTVVLT